MAALVLAAFPGAARGAEGDLTFLQSFTDGAGGVDGLAGANQVAISHDGENLYVAGRFDNSVAVFARNPISGALTFQEVEKDGVAGVDGLLAARRVVVSPDDQNVYVTGMDDDAIAAFTRSQIDGTLTFLDVEKDSVNVAARGLDRALGIAITADGAWVYVAAELDNAINILSRNPVTGTLDYVGKVTNSDPGVSGLNGAVGVALSPDPNQKHLYATSYAGDSLTTWSRNPTTGALTFIEAKTDGVAGVDGLNGADGPEISADGRFMYTSGDIDNAVATFKRDPDAGTVTQTDIERDGVDGVNGIAGVTLFTISPDQKHLYAPGEFDDALAVFNRNSLTGALNFQEVLLDSDPVIDGLDGAEGVVVSPDGKNIYVGSNVNELAVFGREPDTTPPETEVTSGPPDQTSNSTPSFSFASAEQFLAGFQCRLDGAAFGACTSAGGHTAAPLADGAHTFEVRALDTAGNPDPTPAADSFVVDTTAPDTAITAGPAGRTGDTTPTYSFTGSDLNLSGFECQLDGGAFEPCSGGGEHTVPPGLGDGIHSFAVRARDAAGNVDSSPATRSFELDATAPDTQITRRPKNRVFTEKAKVKVRFIWIADEPGGSFMCALDNLPLAPCGNKKAKLKVTSKPGKGRKHLFRVQAVDAVGNPDPTPAIDRFRVIRGRP
jgi:6-phosphogluconolactonase (cycloisomerase 2 family)